MQSCPEFNSDGFLFLMSLIRLLEAEIHHGAQINITPHNQIQVMIEKIRNEEAKDKYQNNATLSERHSPLSNP